MKKIFLALAPAICVALVSIAQAAPSVLSSRFGAPVVDGKSNAESPEMGDLILDSSSGKFYGFNTSSAWASFATPQIKMPTVTNITSCSSNYSPPSGVVYLRVRMVGGGGGGGGGGTGAGNGSAGSATTFGSGASQLSAGGGAGGATGAADGGAGGTSTLGSSAIGSAITGGSGGSGVVPGTPLGLSVVPRCLVEPEPAPTSESELRALQARVAVAVAVRQLQLGVVPGDL